MLKKVYVIYDSKSETYSPPNLHSARGDAIRAFGDAVNTANGTNMLNKYPEDFTLFEIGTYDSTTGLLTVTQKISIGNGLDFVINQDAA